MLSWEQRYEIGIPSIDSQHKMLITLANDLSELLTNAVDGEDVYDRMVVIITALFGYTKDHFAHEEFLLQSVGYPELDAHKEEHSKFIAQLEALDLRALDDDQVAHGKKILNFLITWIFKHISDSDFSYQNVLLSKLNI